MALNFNVDPYYDDFDPNKNFHRILFKPGYAVQARELTQSQTILQDQISKFADHIFQKNTPVSGAKVTYNLEAQHIKINTTINDIIVDVANFDGILIQNVTGDVIARVLAVAEESGGDPPTLVVTYLSGTRFQNSDVIYSVDNVNLQCQAISSNATGVSSIVSISEGVFYVINGFDQSLITESTYSIGNFVNVLPQTIILDKYGSTPSLRVGLNIIETIYDYVDDTSLLDPANGSPNYQGPGADRYVISLDLETRPLTLGDDDGFIELLKLENGNVLKQVNSSVYSTIDEYFAKRTYEESGDYIVSDFKLTPASNTISSSEYDLKVGKGVAYIRGYRIENQSEFVITSDRSRETSGINNDPTLIDFGNYIFIDSANNIPNVSTMPLFDLHITDINNISTGGSANSNTYNSTLVGTARVRGIQFDHYDGTSSETNKYVYKTFLTDIQNTTLSSNVRTASSSSNVAVFDLYGKFSELNDAYKNVTITIDSGTSAGDTRKVIAYNATTKTLTVDAPFTITLDTTSVFTLRYGFKDVNSTVRINTSGYTYTSKANVNIQSKDTGVATGNTFLNNSTNNSELIRYIGYPYVANISDSSYTTTRVFTNQSFGATTASITTGASPFVFLSTSPQDYIIINQTTGAIGSSANISNITLSPDQKTATFTIVGSSDLSSITATVTAKVFSSTASNSNYVLKAKNLVISDNTAVNISGTKIVLSGASTANGNVYVSEVSGQTWIQANAITSITSGQLLYVSDVKRIVKIIDTGYKDVAPTTAMLQNVSNEVTAFYSMDNGQRDSYYGHASIRLIPGRPAPKGDLLVFFDYYKQDTSKGDGYFSVDSYLSPVSSAPENYAEIPFYTAKNGSVYALRDCLDFRPLVANAQKDFTFQYKNVPSYIPVNDSVFVTDYYYYLARRDKLILTKDNTFQIISGTPSINPAFPQEPEGSLVLANISLDPYTAFVPGERLNVFPSLSIEKVKHKRFTMKDIANMENRINNIEYYTALNSLEKNAYSMQIRDVNGFNRFKNGILVDDFSSFATADTGNADFNANVNRRERKLTAAQDVRNYPLESTYLTNASYRLDPETANTLGFKVNTIGETNIFTLPYTTANLAAQILASNTVNLNPFGVSIRQGVMDLNPPMDNWVDTDRQPDIIITDPNLAVYQAGNTVNLLNTGDWKTIPGTEYTKTSTSTSSSSSTTSSTYPSTYRYYPGNGMFLNYPIPYYSWGYGGPFGRPYEGYYGGSVATSTTTSSTTTTRTYASQSQEITYGAYDNLGSTFNNNNGYITDLSILPYIRPQSVIFRAKGMSFNTPVSAWFDGVNVDKYITSPDSIELTNVSGTFLEDDLIGYYSESVFYPIAIVASVYNYPSSNNVRLYVLGNYSSNHVDANKIENARFDTNGNVTGNTAFGTPVTTNTIISIHRSGEISGVGRGITDTNQQTWKFFKLSHPKHGKFNKKYGIWSNAKGEGLYLTNSANTYATFNFTCDSAATHYIKVGARFNKVAAYDVKINNQSISFSNDGSKTKKGTFTSLNGVNNVSFYLAASENAKDSHMAIAIAKKQWPEGDNGVDLNKDYGKKDGGNKDNNQVPLEETVWATDSIVSNTSIVNVSSNTVFKGGGIYYRGVTEISLSGVANTSNGYYTGSKITINTSNLALDEKTGVGKIVPEIYTANIISYIGSNSTCILDSEVNISMGFNANVASDITSKYTINGTANSYILSIDSGSVPSLSTDENGNICGIFNIPANTFKTGDRLFKIDNRLVVTDPDSATTFSESTFTAGGLSAKTQALHFSASISGAKNTFTQTNTRDNVLINTSSRTSTSTTTSVKPAYYSPWYNWGRGWGSYWDPIAQSFLIDKGEYQYGAFISSIKLFFRTKPTTTNTPVTLSIMGTQNGYPNGETLDNSIVTLTADKVKVSTTPHYLDETTYTEFVFPAPVYIQSGQLYAFMLVSSSNEYNAFLGAQNQIALPSSVKAFPTDPTPTVITKIGGSPYVGGLFESQNGITWTAEQSKSLMFMMERCLFDISSEPKLPFSVPRNLPNRKLTGQDIKRYYDANNLSNLQNVTTGQDILVDAINITTTDFIPSGTIASYSYKATKLSDLTYTDEKTITPGKFGCPTNEDIHLDDSLGERILIANSNSSFMLYSTFASSDDTVSPVLADDGLSLYNITYRINNLNLSNNSVVVLNGGTGYSGSTSVTISAPDDANNGIQATATANIIGGVVQSIDIINQGQGYLKTPTITVNDSGTRGGNANVSLIVSGETNPSGGNGFAKYITKTVILTPENESGDLRVFYTAYRPKGTNIYCYYKILNKLDNQNFADQNWTLMTTSSGYSAFSLDRNNLIEFEASPGENGVAADTISYTSTSGVTYTSYNQFAIKIILTTDDNTKVPFLTDIRAIALPSGTGL